MVITGNMDCLPLKKEIRCMGLTPIVDFASWFSASMRTIGVLRCGKCCMTYAIERVEPVLRKGSNRHRRRGLWLDRPRDDDSGPSRRRYGTARVRISLGSNRSFLS